MELKEIVQNIFLESRINLILKQTKKQGLNKIGSYTPISLRNTDTNIFLKTCAKRVQHNLEKIMTKLISSQ